MMASPRGGLAESGLRAPRVGWHTQSPGMAMQPPRCALDGGGSSILAERSWESRSNAR